MKVRDVMSRSVQLTTPSEDIQQAARLMGEIDAGVLPVAEGDRLIGMITDRDITVRAVAAGKSPDTPVAEIMSEEVLYCFEDENGEKVSRNMADNKVRRMPVLNREKRLVGIISIGDLARSDNPTTTGKAVSEISKPGGQHSQSSNE